MIKAMPRRRREEIRRADQSILRSDPSPNSVYAHRRELIREMDRLSDLIERLDAAVGALDFDRSESGLPETQEQWIEFVRGVDEKAQKILSEYDGSDEEYYGRRAEIMLRYTPQLKALGIKDPAYAVIWNERREALAALDAEYRSSREEG